MAVSPAYATKVAPVEIISAPGKITARVICRSCDGHNEWTMSALPEPAIVQRHFLVRGWNIKARPTCPECSSKKKEKAPVIKIDNVVAPIKSVPVDPDAERKNKRLVILALEDYFDETKRQFRDGKNDTIIANELDLAVGFVAKVREEFYGKMAEPSEVTQLRNEAGALLSKITKLSEEQVALNTKIISLVSKNGWAV